MTPQKTIEYQPPMQRCQGCCIGVDNSDRGLLESVLGIGVEPDEAILRLPKRGTPKMASLKPTA
eukprot:scaffold89_cov177-Chaetoceros_neogracile.AAC.1